MWTFFKAQLSSLFATVLDFTVTIFLVEALKINYVESTILGAFAGAIGNFYVNKYWAFDTGKTQLKKQSYRYSVVWVGSVILNASGIYLLSHFFKTAYVIAKIIVAIVVGVGFNYTLQKRYVFNSHEEVLHS